MLIAQLDAAPEARDRTHHAAVGVVRIAEPARRVHLPQRIGQGFRKGERSFVRGAAGVVVSARELKIAANVVDLARLAREARRERLRFGERRERRVHAADEPLPGGDSDQRPATLGRQR